MRLRRRHHLLVDGRATVERPLTSSAPERRYTYCECLELEARSDVQYEFFDGVVYAMSGRSPDRSVALTAQLTAKLCQAFTSDLRVRVLETGLATHPDVAVI